MKPSSQTVAANIVKRRLKAKLTQPDLAALAGVSRSVMWYVEQGRNPCTDTLDKIAAALKCQTKDFFK